MSRVHLISSQRLLRTCHPESWWLCHPAEACTCIVGGNTEKLMETMNKKDQTLLSFKQKARSALVNCAKYMYMYMQGVLPLDSQTVQVLSCIDSSISTHSMAKQGLYDLASSKLGVGLGTHLSGKGTSDILHEILEYQTCHHIDQTPIITEWGASVMNAGRYREIPQFVCCSEHLSWATSRSLI